MRARRPGTSRPFDPEYLDDLIRALEARFGWEEEFQGLTPTRYWESREKALYEFRATTGSVGVILMVGRRWTEEKAFEVHEDLRNLGSLFDSKPGLNVGFPRVMGWLDSPPLVCEVLVDGEELGRALGLRQRYRSEDIERAIHQLGCALGHFHASELIDPAISESVIRDVIQADLSDMARRLRVDRGIADLGHYDWLISRKYGDFSPANSIRSADGHIWLVDQPSAFTLRPIHRDVAYFFDRLIKLVGRHQPGSPEEVKSVIADLQHIFLSAYGETGPSQLVSRPDRALIALYRSYMGLTTAQRRFRKHQYLEIPGQLLHAYRWRREALSLRD